MKRVKAILQFPPEHFNKPITYRLVKDYHLVINILRAEVVANKAGELIMDLDGREEDIDRAVAFLSDEGITFRILKGGVALDESRCVHCGACTSICPSGALAIDRSDWNVVFRPEECYACELCVKACPLRALTASLGSASVGE